MKYKAGDMVLMKRFVSRSTYKVFFEEDERRVITEIRAGCYHFKGTGMIASDTNIKCVLNFQYYLEKL